jgi:hypothetical protein
VAVPNCAYQPGSVVLSDHVFAVPVVASVLKFWVIGVPRLVTLSADTVCMKCPKLPVSASAEAKMKATKRAGLVRTEL